MATAVTSGKSLVALAGWTASDLVEILDAAQRMLEAWRDNRLPSPLRDRSVALLFVEPSTRTHVSFEQAVHLLGGRPVYLAGEESSLVKGETLFDTAETLRATGVAALVVRHPAQGEPERLAARMDIPVINAGDGTHEHPTQGLLDILTIRQAFGRVEGLRIAIVGDSLHSRVARSTAAGLVALGAQVVFVGPPTLVPQGLAPALGVEVNHDLRDGLSGADVVMALRLQKERMQAAYLPSNAEYHAIWGVTAERLGWAKPDACFMHPGPSNRGVEVTTSVHDGVRSLVRGQVRNGVAVRMAVLTRCVA